MSKWCQNAHFGEFFETFKWVYLTIGLWIVMLHYYELSNVDPSHWATNQPSQWSPFWLCVKSECIHSVNPGMKSSRLLGSLLQSNCEHASFSAVNISVILRSLWETAGRWVAHSTHSVPGILKTCKVIHGGIPNMRAH